MLRSHEGGLTLCYALRRLANNVQEPFRTLSLQAIDTSIKWWQGGPARRAAALRSPWSLTPNLQRHLKQFLRKWHLEVLSYQVPCHNPSFKMVFIKLQLYSTNFVTTNRPSLPGQVVKMPVLLQTLAEIQGSSSQSVRSSLGSGRISPSLAASS